MHDSTSSSVESEVPLFNVVVGIPSGVSVEEAEHHARVSAAIPEDRLDLVIKALRNGPSVKIGSGITRERAEALKLQFNKAGLTIEITPALALQIKTNGTYDGLFVCLACNERVTLPSNRQCPKCGVFVDKITEEFLLRKKIMAQERAKLNIQANRDSKETEKRSKQAMEAAIRAEVRKELEKEFGVDGYTGVFGGRAGLFRATGLVALLALAFFGGKFTPQSGWPWAEKSSANATSPENIDKMLSTVGPKTNGAANIASSDAAPLDVEDMLIQQSANQQGKKTISAEQAVAAATMLAKSVGVGVPGTGSGSVNASAATNQVNGLSTDTNNPASASAQINAVIPNELKLILVAEFAKKLSELGQWQRAQGILNILKTSPNLTTQPEADQVIRMADVEVRAWSIKPMGESGARQAVEALRTDAAALTNPAERVQALSRIAVVLRQHTHLSAEASHAFLTLAGQALKSITDTNQRSVALGDWTAALGEVLLNDVLAHAKSGAWSKAQAAAEKIEGLIKQGGEATTLVSLYAIDFQIKQILGQSAKASQSLGAALDLVAKNPNLTERAAGLRLIARLSGSSAHSLLQAAMETLTTQLASQSGFGKAQALTQLALLNAEEGRRAKTEQYNQLAQATTGLSAPETLVINTNLVVRGDMAMAKVLHGLGQYPESEALLRRLAGYLL